MTRVKICGLTRVDDVRAAVDAGADAVGFVFEPSSPRCIADPLEAFVLMEYAGPFVTCVSVFAEPPEVAAKHPGMLQAFSKPKDLPTDRFLAVHRVRSNDDPALVVADLTAIAPAGIVLDPYSENNKGGSGVVADWVVAAEIVRLSPVPVILAGGLTAENVAEAITKVRPYAVDVSSGVESAPGIKDPQKVRDFCAEVRKSE